MKTLMLLSLTLFAIMLTVSANAQVTCFQYGNMTSCDGPRGQNTLQTDLGNGKGVIMDSRGTLEPYAILPAPSRESRPLNDVLPKRQPVPTLQEYQPYQPMEPTSPVFIPMFGGEAGRAPY